VNFSTSLRTHLTTGLKQNAVRRLIPGEGIKMTALENAGKPHGRRNADRCSSQMWRTLMDAWLI